MAVRNFYVEANIDGRETTLGGGPRNKMGEMTVRLYQRDEGEITDALLIECRERDGVLITEVYDKDHNLIFTNETKR